jgi:hypothetical protein
VALQNEPQYATINESMEKALEALKVFEEGKINDIKIRNKIKWLEKGHATNK